MRILEELERIMRSVGPLIEPDPALRAVFG